MELFDVEAWVRIVLTTAALVGAFIWGRRHASKYRPHKDWQHSFLTGMMSIFHEGEVARERGDSVFSDNPYDLNSPEYRSWSFGFCWVDNRTARIDVEARAIELLDLAMAVDLSSTDGGQELTREDAILTMLEIALKEGLVSTI